MLSGNRLQARKFEEPPEFRSFKSQLSNELSFPSSRRDLEYVVTMRTGTC